MQTALEAPPRHEISEYTIKLLIGLIAFGLPMAEWLLTLGDPRDQFTSISASFYIDWPAWSQGFWPRNIFVGSLFAIGGLLLTYNGWTRGEMRLTKLAAAAAVVIAMFPCGCGPEQPEIIAHVHAIAAGVMFGVLAIFCFIFRRRALDKHQVDEAPQPKWRAWIYTACGVLMVLSILLFAGASVIDFRHRILVAEWVGLWAFAVSWLTASHYVPGINLPDEREYPFRDRTPQDMAKGVAMRAAAKKKATISPN